MSFVIVYLAVLVIVLGSVALFLTAISLRNRVILAIAAVLNIIANPLASLANGVRSLSVVAAGAVPETAFAPGVVRRILYLVSFLILAGADWGLAAGRLQVAFGIDAGAPPFDISWMTALAWVVSAGFFGVVSLELRMDPVSHPWDQLDARMRPLVRRGSDILLAVTTLSAVMFYAFGALAVIGVYSTILSIIFMTLLGLALTLAAAVSLWASVDAWTTLYGVVLVIGMLLLRGLAGIPECIIIALRNLGRLLMSVVDVPFMGVAYPLNKWWARSRLGKALGFPGGQEPIAWPPIGVLERALLPEVWPNEDGLLLHFPAPLDPAVGDEEER